MNKNGLALRFDAAVKEVTPVNTELLLLVTSNQYINNKVM